MGPKTLCNACGVRDGRRQSKGWGGTGPSAQRARKTVSSGSKLMKSEGAVTTAAGRGYGSSTTTAPLRSGYRARAAGDEGTAPWRLRPARAPKRDEDEDYEEEEEEEEMMPAPAPTRVVKLKRSFPSAGAFTGDAANGEGASFEWAGALPAAMLPGATPVWVVLGRDASLWAGVRLCVVPRTSASGGLLSGTAVPASLMQMSAPPLLRTMPVRADTLAHTESSTEAEANVWWASTTDYGEHVAGAPARNGSGSSLGSSRTIPQTAAAAWGVRLSDAPSKGALLALLRSAADTNAALETSAVSAAVRPWLPGAAPHAYELDVTDHAWLAGSGAALSAVQTALLFESFQTVAASGDDLSAPALHALLTAGAASHALVVPVPSAAALEVALARWLDSRSTSTTGSSGRRAVRVAESRGAGGRVLVGVGKMGSPPRTDSRTDSSNVAVSANHHCGVRKPSQSANKLRKMGGNTNGAVAHYGMAGLNGNSDSDSDSETEDPAAARNTMPQGGGQDWRHERQGASVLQSSAEAPESQLGLLYTLGDSAGRMPSAENLLNPLDRGMYLLEPQSMESESMGLMGFHSSPEESSLLSGMVPLWEEHSGAHLLEAALA